MKLDGLANGDVGKVAGVFARDAANGTKLAGGKMPLGMAMRIMK